MNKAIIGIVVIAVVAGGAFYFLQPEESTGPKTHEVALHFEGVQIVHGPKMLTARRGDTVELIVTADAEEEFHLHGYDRSIDIGPDKEPTLTVVADTAGRFIAELEGSKEEGVVLEGKR